MSEEFISMSISTFVFPLLTYRQKKVRNIMRYIHRNSHISKVKAITQANQRQRDDMMQHQLPEILPRFLQLQHQD